MKPIILLGAAALLTAFVAGCEFDNGIATRAREKPGVYAALLPWQKRYVDKGVIAQGFTTDMVYLAMGQPTKTETKEIPEGHAELWTYTNYYPNVTQASVAGYQSAGFNQDSAFQGQFQTTKSNGQPVWMGTPQSISRTGPPQGGSMEPADLQSYTFLVLFENGKVTRFLAGKNP